MTLPARSLFHALMIRLAGVALMAAALLLVVVMGEYGFTLSDFAAPERWPVSIPEVVDHVVIPIAIIAIPMVVVGAVVVRTAFAPLYSVADSVAASLGKERGFRLPVADIPLETVPFVTSINALLARLDEAAQRHESFAADVAHELRGALALMALQVDRLDAAASGSMKRDLASLRRLVDQLMLLARADAAAAAQLPQESIALGEIAAQAVSLAAPDVIGAGRSIELETSGRECRIEGHREAILAALRNLIDNAMRVTPSGGAIRVLAGPGPILRVQDGGAGLSPARLEQLKKRFVRAENASHEGAGLGLSIVDRIMTAHGGEVLANPRQKELLLRFPERS